MISAVEYLSLDVLIAIFVAAIAVKDGSQLG